MAQSRRNLSTAEEIALVTQVNRACPLCGEESFYTKEKTKTQKAYEIAHIYPLNPTQREVNLLAEEERLASDLNHIDNLIALCRRCHGRFDKPRTKEEYRELLSIKKAFIRRERIQSLQAKYPLEEEIHLVISALYSDEIEDEDTELSYDPKTLAQKLDSTITRPTERIIRHHVSDYFPYIKRKLLEVESENPNASELISSQVRSFYLSQKVLDLSQREVFENMKSWMISKCNKSTPDAAEIVAAFFIQNCEIFE